jgi:predicted permease
MLSDIRYALRTLATHPSFSAAAIATLAIGIAANTVVFTLLDALALRPLPVPAAHRVVRLYPVDLNGRRSNLFSYADFREYRAQASGFEALAAYIPADVTIGRSSRDAAPVEPRAAIAYVVTNGYFEVAGIRATLGRLLGPADEGDTGAPPIVISYAMWRARFGSDPTILGSTLAVNGRAFTIVGVGPAAFAGTEPLVADLWAPIGAQPVVEPGADVLENHDSGWLLVIGRLSHTATQRSVSDALSVLARRLAAVYPGERRPASVAVVPATFFTLDPGARGVIALVMGIVGLVLLIACANVANLMLARAAGRHREIAVRLAIGASRWRIVRQLVTETMLMSIIAGGAALLASVWVLRALYAIGLNLAAFPWTITLSLSPDASVFVYTFLLATGAGMLFGFVPALQISSPRITAALHDDGALLGAKVSRSRIRNSLVVVQVACSLVLLITAALLTRGLFRTQALDLGFDTENVIFTEYDLERAGYSIERASEFNDRLRQRAARVPGVAIAGFTSHVPLHGGIRRVDVRLATEGTSGSQRTTAVSTTISPEYFSALGIRIVSGRNFNEDDQSGRMSTAIISEGLARRFWPAGSALGQSVILSESSTPATIVGIARDTSSGSIWREKEMSIYLPMRRAGDPRKLQLIVRTASDPMATAAALREIATDLDRDMRFKALPLDLLLRLWILPSRIAAAGSAILGLLALALASVGIYGVLAYLVSQRTREIGIRMALGASATDVLGLIIGEGSRLVAIGVVLGIAGAAAGAPLLRAWLFDVSPKDPIAFIAASTMLTVVALGACYIPARRAANLQPLAALRRE